MSDLRAHRRMARSILGRMFCVVVLTVCSFSVRGGVGDPQVSTDHMWYPGELACSTFDRLFATQGRLYEAVTGAKPATDEEKALAAWLWRSTHYFHGEEGAEDLWGKGFTKGWDSRTREYWTGLFAHGFGLCGTTHSQWTAEMQALLGHNRGRGVGVAGHNSFEVFLTGGAYGPGKWVMLDHDVSTIAFNDHGSALLSVSEVRRDWKRILDRNYKPERQRGWPICGLHPGDASAFSEYKGAEYFAGYEGVPPIVHLRRGETMRRYPQPGLPDGKTFVFWGRNYNTANVPGPERSLTWVNQPEKLLGGVKGAPYHEGQARFGNAVYTYRPNFENGDYREAAISEDDSQVTFEFYTPYIIASTPASNAPWGIYEDGGRNGLVLNGKASCSISLSTDQGANWQDCGPFRDGMDLTDFVKGRRQYFLRLNAGAGALKSSELTVITVCQANPSTMPRLKSHGSLVTFQANDRAVVSAGPNLPQAKAHIVEGAFDSPKVTLELSPPRGETAVAVYAAAHVMSGNPPNPESKYRIEISADDGKTWEPMVSDWSITRRGEEPKDFWSQSMCWGKSDLPDNAGSKVRVRFSNDAGRKYGRAEAHLVYRNKVQDSTKVTFAWTDDRGNKEEGHVFLGATNASKVLTWNVGTGANTQTRWIEFEPVFAGTR